MRLDKQASGRRWIDLQTRLNSWDPLGLIEMGAPIDEYDCVLGPLMRRLESGDDPVSIAAFLDQEFVEHFGERVRDFGSKAFAEQSRQWFDEHWRGTIV
jgi:hypothetical protein